MLQMPHISQIKLNLLDAIERRSLPDFQSFIANTTKTEFEETINQLDNEGWTLFHRAVCAGHVQIINCLISAGADVCKPGQNGKTALHLAMQPERSTEVVRCLLEAGADLDAVDNEGWTPLQCATEASARMVEIVIDLRGAASARACLNKPGVDGLTPLHHLVMSNSPVEFVQRLLEICDDVNKPSPSGKTALHFAVLKRDPDRIRCLIRAGADIHKPDDDGITPLQKDQSGIITLLAEEPQTQQALVLALRNRLRLSGPRSGSAFPAVYGSSLELEFSENIKSDSDVQQWMDNTTKIEIETAVGSSKNLFARLLKIAINRYSLETIKKIIQYLLKMGVDMNQSDFTEQTALHVAASEGHVEVVKCLVEAGAHINRPDHNGRTPLYYAKVRGHVEVVEYLETREQSQEPMLFSGSRRQKPDDPGSTPMLRLKPL